MKCATEDIHLAIYPFSKEKKSIVLRWKTPTKINLIAIVGATQEITCVYNPTFSIKKDNV